MRSHYTKSKPFIVLEPFKKLLMVFEVFADINRLIFYVTKLYWSEYFWMVEFGCFYQTPRYVFNTLYIRDPQIACVVISLAELLRWWW